jgi:hypothetical protein
MSDTICSYLQFIINSEVDKKKNIGRKEALEIYEKIRAQAGRELNIQIRYYDKADLLFRKMYSNAVTADLAKMYEQEYIMHKNGLKGELLKVSPDPESQRDRRDYEISGYYDEILVPQLENYVSELLKTEKYRKLVEARFAEYLDYTESFMGRGDDLSYDKGLYIIEKLNKLSEVLTEDQIKRKTGATLFKLNDIRLRALNHKGTVSGLIPVVEECEKYRQFVNPFDYIDFKIRTSQLYFNSFEYDKAKDMFLQVAENQNGDLNSALDNLESAVAVLTGGAGTSGIGISGKVFSSLGQAYAFAGDKETSEKRFKDALEKWGDDKGNRNITMSYLLHMYIDNGEKESYESLAPEYFGYFNTDETLDLTTREGQLEALSKCYENHGFIRYAFFVFVKAFYAFYRKSEPGITVKIAALIERMEKNKDTGNNPWQNIYKYMYRMALENGSQKNADKYAAKVFEEVSGDAAVSVIQLNFELEKYLDAGGDENKILSEFLQNSCIKDIEKKLGEFPCFEGIADKSVADAKALLDSRLTYMYR